MKFKGGAVQKQVADKTGMGTVSTTLPYLLSLFILLFGVFIFYNASPNA